MILITFFNNSGIVAVLGAFVCWLDGGGCDSGVRAGCPLSGPWVVRFPWLLPSACQSVFVQHTGLNGKSCEAVDYSHI